MEGSDKLVVVCGPTATGKSRLALELARRFGGEILSADSMQVYKGLPVGTAALTAQEAGGIPVHLSGFLPPQKAYSVANWLQDAETAIAGMHRAGVLPVVCGGTGLYVKSLLEGSAFAPETGSGPLRRQLESEWEAQGGNVLYARLAALDAEAAGRLHPNDKKRVVRQLELHMQTGQTEQQRNSAHQGAPRYPALCIGLDYEQRSDLYAAIERRVDVMMETGLLAEARAVWALRTEYVTAAQAIGYKELFPYFEGQCELDACVDKLKQATRNFAKRQRTWFRAMPGIHWLPADGCGTPNEAAQLTKAFLDENIAGNKSKKR